MYPLILTVIVVSNGCKPAGGRQEGSLLYRHQPFELPQRLDIDGTCPVRTISQNVPGPVGSPESNERYKQILQGTTISEGETAQNSFRLSLIQIFRTNEQEHQVRYFGNGAQLTRFIPWHSSYFMSFALAAARLREASRGQVGIDGSVTNKRERRVWIGDLATAVSAQIDSLIPQYVRDDQTLDAKSIGSWMHALAGGDEATTKLRQMFPHASEETLADFSNRADDLFPPRFSSSRGNVYTGLKPISSTSKSTAQISALTQAEFLKQLVLFREEKPKTGPMSHLRWSDIQTILYGTNSEIRSIEKEREKSGQTAFVSNRIGGMSVGASSFLQLAIEDLFNLKQTTDVLDKGWSMLTQVGYGPNDGLELNSDLSLIGYACLPFKEDTSFRKEHPGTTGVEFVYALTLFGSPSRFGDAADSLMAKALSDVMREMLDVKGRAEPRDRVATQGLE